MSYQRWFANLLFILAASSAVCAHAQDNWPEYKLGPGDIVRIQVYQNPDLTLETRVTENGTITFPLIGSVKIGGLTVSSAETAIGNALKAGGFIKQPQVNIVPVQIRSTQVSVLGQVNRPGRFPIETANVTVSEMLAIAGGITPGGADTVILTGTRGGKPFRREIDIRGMFLDDKAQNNVMVANGDVIYVDRAPMLHIYGEVQRPGPLRVERKMTIRQALAEGGGPTARGSELNLSVYRRDPDGKVVTLVPDLNDQVRPDDVIYVSESVFRAVTESKARNEDASKVRNEDASKAPTRPAQSPR